MRPTPSGRQPHSRAVVGASIPVRDNGYASAGAPKGFSLVSLETFGHRSWRDPHGTLAPKPLPILYNYPRENFSFCQHFPSAERITAFLQENPPFPAAYVAFRFFLA